MRCRCRCRMPRHSIRWIAIAKLGLRLRCQAARDLLDRLEAEHRPGQRTLVTLTHAPTRYREGGVDEFHVFDTPAADDAGFEFSHMQTAERGMMPFAEKYLTPSDWGTIDASLLAHEARPFGASTRGKFRELLRRRRDRVGHSCRNRECELVRHHFRAIRRDHRRIRRKANGAAPDARRSATCIGLDGQLRLSTGRACYAAGAGSKERRHRFRP